MTIPTLQELILFGNDIGPGLATLLEDPTFFTKAAALKQLDISVNNVASTFVHTLALSSNCNRCMQQSSLTFTHIGC